MEKMLVALIVLTAVIYLVRQLISAAGSSSPCAGCGASQGCDDCPNRPKEESEQEPLSKP